MAVLLERNYNVFNMVESRKIMGMENLRWTDMK